MNVSKVSLSSSVFPPQVRVPAQFWFLLQSPERTECTRQGGSWS